MLVGMGGEVDNFQMYHLLGPFIPFFGVHDITYRSNMDTLRG